MTHAIYGTIIVFLSLALIGAIIKEAELTAEIRVLRNQYKGSEY